MKPILFSLIIWSVGQFSAATSILVDDFSHRSFIIGSDTHLSKATSRPLDDRLFRTLSVTGNSLFDWVVTQDMSSQTLTYQVDTGGGGVNRDSLELRYSTGSQEGISLLGSTSVVIDADILQGSFNWYIEVNDREGTNRELGQQLFSGTETEFSFSDILGNPDFSDVDWFQISFFPLEPQSEIRVNSIRLVPEPSSSLLLLFGIPMIWRRRRG